VRALALLACASAAACSSPAPLPEPTRATPERAVEIAEEPAVDPAIVAGEGVAYETVVSNAGTYRIRWRVWDGALERGRDFVLEVEVARADAPGEIATDVTLAVDAEMPEHRHGMSVVPAVVPGALGTFRVEGMRFHMSGRWDLFLDVTRGAWTERAQVRIELP
jgi:hypothetical protein